MAADDLGTLLQGAAPRPTSSLDMANVERRARRRRHGRQATTAGVVLLAAMAVVGVVGVLFGPDRRQIVVAGPPASAELPILYSKQNAIVLPLLDGTKVLVNLPGPLSDAFAHVPFSDLELHGSVYAQLDLHTGVRSQPQPPRGWEIDVVLGDARTLVGGEPVTSAAPSPASAAWVDRGAKRLGLQFGPWTAILRGDSLTGDDIESLVRGIDLVTDRDGYPQYRGSLPLWVVDAPDAAIQGRGMSLSVFMRDCTASASGATVTGPIVESADGRTVMCDASRKVEVQVTSSTPLPDSLVNNANLFVAVRSIGSSLAGIQAGLHP
jgi:hypothetical protein